MKIGGRTFRSDKINSNTENLFDAYYKKHHVYVEYIKDRGGMKDYNVEVRDETGILACDTIVTRCQIRDAIIYALDGAMI